MNILLVQTSFLGDNILSTPVPKAIKARYPNCKLSVLTIPNAKLIYENNPNIDEILLFEKHGAAKGVLGLLSFAKRLKQNKFEKVFSLHRSARTSLLLYLAKIPERIGFNSASLSFLYTKQISRPKNCHEVDRNLAILGEPSSFSTDDKELFLFPPGHDELSELVKSNLPFPSDYIVLVPGSIWPTKRWFLEGYVSVAKHFNSKNIPVILLGSSLEQELTQKIANEVGVLDLAGKTTLSEMFFIIKHAKLVVCNDSMSLHVASAFKVPTVAIFCATSPSFGFGPWLNSKALVVEKENLACKPCRRHGSSLCPTGTEACMRELSPVKVIKAAEKVMI